MKKTIVTVAALLMLLCANSVLAATIVSEFQGITEPPSRDVSWKAGLGVAYLPDYEGSQDYTIAPIPFLSVAAKSGLSAELLGNVLRVNAIPSNTWRLGPLVRFRSERDDVDNNKVDSMQKVDSALEMGGYAGFDINNWSLKVDVTHDTSGTYNGTLGGLSLGYTWLTNPWRFTLSGSTSIADDRYMQTYFGVNAADSAASGLPQYDLGGGFKDVGATFIAGNKLNDRWTITGALRYTALIGDAADSPLVDDEGSASQVLFGVMASYSF